MTTEITAETIAAARRLIHIASLRHLAEHEADQLAGVLYALAIRAGVDLTNAPPPRRTVG